MFVAVSKFRMLFILLNYVSDNKYMIHFVAHLLISFEHDEAKIRLNLLKYLDMMHMNYTQMQIFWEKVHPGPSSNTSGSIFLVQISP